MLVITFHTHTGSSQKISNEGRRFAIALPPASSVRQGHLIMTARQNTTVIISYPFLINELVYLEANITTRFGLDGGLLRCVDGLEDKGVLVTAASPIVILLGNEWLDAGGNPDHTTLRPIPETVTDIFLVGYSNGSSGTQRPKSFYIITPFEADTEVQVFKKEGDSHALAHQFTLGRNQVFTEDAFYNTSDENYWIDYTGWFVRASKPVAVYSGHGCAQLPATVSAPSASHVYWERQNKMICLNSS